MTHPTPPRRTPHPEATGLATRRLQRAGWVFETGILEQLLERQPDDVAVIAALAEAYTRMRCYRRGLELDRRLIERDPGDPLFRYNFACSCALTGDLDAACAALLAAFDRGYRDFDHLLRDPDLRRLRRDDHFGPVRERMEQLAREASG